MDESARRRLIRESDSGRAFGWSVELNGRRIARLEDPVWDANSQFWHHYRLVVVTEDPAERAALLDPSFWTSHLSELSFRNLGLNEFAADAFPSGKVFDERGRVWMRGLYLTET
jgi:hypothetical protein